MAYNVMSGEGEGVMTSEEKEVLEVDFGWRGVGELVRKRK